jgi:hypothetical protein
MGADAVRAQQNDLGAPDMLMRCVAIPREGRQAAAVIGLELSIAEPRNSYEPSQRAPIKRIR